MSPKTSLEWVEVTPDGEVVRMRGPLDTVLLAATVLGAPTQVRSPWDATVFIGEKAGFVGQPNWLAATLLRQSLTPGQIVPGSMVVLGPPDDEGDPTDITDALAADIATAIHKMRLAAALMPVVAFDVRGTPVPQGSKRAFVVGTRAVVVDANAVPLDRYRSDIRATAEVAMDKVSLYLPTRHRVAVAIVFNIAHPESHFTKVSRRLRVASPTWPNRPDIDKMARAVLDALTDMVIRDDGQVVDLRAVKAYLPDPTDTSYTSITVSW